MLAGELGFEPDFLGVRSPLCQIVSSRFFYKMGSNAIVSDQRVTPDLQSANCSAFGADRRDQQHQHLPDLNPCSARAPSGRSRAIPSATLFALAAVEKSPRRGAATWAIQGKPLCHQDQESERARAACQSPFSDPNSRPASHRSGGRHRWH